MLKTAVRAKSNSRSSSSSSSSSSSTPLGFMVDGEFLVAASISRHFQDMMVDHRLQLLVLETEIADVTRTALELASNKK